MPASVSVSPTSVTLQSLGETTKLDADVRDQDGNPMPAATVAWSSGDASVVSVDSTGLVTAVGPGATTVTATVGALSAAARVEVLGGSGDRDREVLEELYRATGGDGWRESTNWLTDAPISEWYGVTTNDEGYVTELFLIRNNLTGPLPPEIGDLIHLEKLELHQNALEGPIPPEIGKLAKVRDLYLSGNRLEGSIPPEIGGLASVEALFLSFNGLSGPLPSEIGNLKNLRRLALWNNQLTGPLPSSLGNLKNLHDLSLTDNRIDGRLPSQIGDITSLVVLAISRNRISGSLPPELGQLGALKRFLADDNRLDGSIPREIGNLASLEELILSRNRFSGTIPPELGGLSDLRFLWLFENQLTGEIPAQLGNLAKLENMAISDNSLTGRIPPELGRLSALEALVVGRNNISGRIPPELGRLPALTALHLCGNDLSGPVPPEIGGMGALKGLRLCNNPELSGLLPRRLMNLERLQEFDFTATGLCPQIDGEFQAWLHAVKGRGTECDPALVDRLALEELFVRTNPDSWTNRAGWNSGAPLANWYGVTAPDGRVRALKLPDNGIRGPLPPEIANLSKLSVLHLGDNHLVGPLPDVLGGMPELETIWVSGNPEMEGRLPFRLSELPGLGILAWANTGLCASPANTFQRWLGRLQLADGATCGNPESVHVSLPVVYLTQSIQRPEGDVPLIAGRDALLRVFLTSGEAQAFFEPEVVATVSAPGVELFRVTMRRNDDLLATSVDESDLSSSYNAVVPGEYIVPGAELVVEADPEGRLPLAPGSSARFPSSGSWPLNVVSAPPMELTVVPVVEGDRLDWSILGWTDGIGDDSPEVGLLRYAFPFSEFRVDVRDAYITSLDLARRSHRWRLVLELEVVRAAENGRGYYYGAAVGANGLARLGGWVSVGRPWSTELAHELGHNLNLEHAPCGGAPDTDPKFPYADGSIGVWGYDFRDGNVVSPNRRRDIMGYCYDEGWLSDYYFEKVIEYRSQLEARKAHATAVAGPKSRTLVLWGGVVDGELTIEPPFSMSATARLPDAGGPYRLEGLGRAGQVEFSLTFTPGEDKFGDKYFFFTVPLEADEAGSLDRLTLTGPEGTVTLSAADERTLTVVSDPATGRIRGILRDWEGDPPSTLGAAADFTVSTFRGLAEAVGSQR
ncbi:leucine-rich repeat domain-containing protein [Candidatus Palauibacter sp.]|uniref:leucine-rich repeat domain-containing protein n=1 Tax=Candidatus Palauibacter sp. TaxID=3101350 RepID=UPI003B02657E